MDQIGLSPWTGYYNLTSSRQSSLLDEQGMYYERSKVGAQTWVYSTFLTHYSPNMRISRHRIFSQHDEMVQRAMVSRMTPML